MIERCHAQRAVALVRGQSHLDSDAVPERGQPGIIDLKHETGLRDGLYSTLTASAIANTNSSCDL
jgi:hypothetical protein